MFTRRVISQWPNPQINAEVDKEETVNVRVGGCHGLFSLFLDSWTSNLS
jgi:hypothetical protein